MKAIFDMESNAWDITGSPGPGGCVLGFGFRNNGTLPVDLRNVASFGWILDGTVETHPKGGRLLSSALDVVVQKNLVLVPDTAYTITLFVELHDAGRQEYVHEFVTPIPDAPFSSWAWDTERKVHAAPVPKPDDGAWVWDEDARAWAPCPHEAQAVLDASDAGMARTLEDLIHLLEAGNVIQRTQLPQASQLRLAAREAARDVLRTASTKGLS